MKTESKRWPSYDGKNFANRTDLTSCPMVGGKADSNLDIKWSGLVRGFENVRFLSSVSSIATRDDAQAVVRTAIGIVIGLKSEAERIDREGNEKSVS